MNRAYDRATDPINLIVALEITVTQVATAYVAMGDMMNSFVNIRKRMTTGMVSEMGLIKETEDPRV